VWGRYKDTLTLLHITASSLLGHIWIIAPDPASLPIRDKISSRDKETSEMTHHEAVPRLGEKARVYLNLVQLTDLSAQLAAESSALNIFTSNQEGFLLSLFESPSS